MKIVCYNILVFRGIAQLVEQRSPKPRAVSSSLTTPAKKKDIHWMSFFSYICLWQVILLRSYIRLTPSDIVLSHSIKAKIISLKLEVSISLLIYQKYHSIEDGISLFLHQFPIRSYPFPNIPSATSSKKHQRILFSLITAYQILIPLRVN